MIQGIFQAEGGAFRSLLKPPLGFEVVGIGRNIFIVGMRVDVMPTGAYGNYDK